MPDNNLQPLLDTQQNELAAQANLGDIIESRNLAMFAANIAILIYVGQADFALSGWLWLLLLVPFLLSAVFNFLLMFSSNTQYKSNVNLADHPEYLALDTESLMLQLISDTLAAVEYNKKVNKKRLLRFQLSLFSTIIGVLVLFVIIKVWET